MKLRVIGDGDPNTTKVVHADTGEELEGVIDVHWHVDTSDTPIPVLELKLYFQHINIESTYRSREYLERNSKA